MVKKHMNYFIHVMYQEKKYKIKGPQKGPFLFCVNKKNDYVVRSIMSD